MCVKASFLNVVPSNLVRIGQVEVQTILTATSIVLAKLNAQTISTASRRITVPNISNIAGKNTFPKNYELYQ